MVEQQAACGHCGQAASKRCRGCKTMQYCTAECQQADWQFHKILCKSFADFAERPNNEVRRAILLPEKSDKPIFIWMPVQEGDMGTKKMMHTAVGGVSNTDDFGVPDSEVADRYILPQKGNPVVEEGHGSHSLILIRNKLRSGELLDHSIHLLACWDKSGTTPNRCIVRFAREKFARPYGGPLIIYAMTRFKSPVTTVDMNTVGFTLALDSIRIRNGPSMPNPLTKKVTGVKTNSFGPLYEEVQVPIRHPVFENSMISEIADLIGGPLNAWTYPGSTSGQSSNGTDTSTQSENDPKIPPKVVLTTFDTTSPDFGRIPAAILNNKRSMLFVRPLECSNETLDIELLEGLVKFYGTTIMMWLAATVGWTNEEKRRELLKMTEAFKDSAKVVKRAREGDPAALEDFRKKTGMDLPPEPEQ